MVKTEINNYAQRPPELDGDILTDIRNSVRTGLQIDSRMTDPQEAALFLETVSRSFFYSSRFLGIPGVDFALGDGNSGKTKYLAKADVEASGRGVITFNQDYVDARLMSFNQAFMIPPLKPYRIDLSPAEVTAHEAYHIWQLLAAPRRVRREASTEIAAGNWDYALSERAAKRFSRLLVLNMTSAQHASEVQIFGGLEQAKTPTSPNKTR